MPSTPEPPGAQAAPLPHQVTPSCSATYIGKQFYQRVVCKFSSKPERTPQSNGTDRQKKWKDEAIQSAKHALPDRSECSLIQERARKETNATTDIKVPVQHTCTQTHQQCQRGKRDVSHSNQAASAARKTSFV